MKFCVIGLGRFGYQVATVLAENGMEVLAIDSNESIIASIRDQVTQAICMRVTDETSLHSIGIDEMDTVIIAMGEDFAQSILITALAKKIGVPKVISRAISEIHKDILKLVGAHRIILPEKEIGIRLADNLSSPFVDLIRLTKEFAISQIVAPASFVEKTVQTLELYTKYGVRCIGLKQDETIVAIDPNYTIQKYDRLIFAGNHDALEKIANLK